MSAPHQQLNDGINAWSASSSSVVLSDIDEEAGRIAAMAAKNKAANDAARAKEESRKKSKEQQLAEEKSRVVLLGRWLRRTVPCDVLLFWFQVLGEISVYRVCVWELQRLSSELAVPKGSSLSLLHIRWRNIWHLRGNSETIGGSAVASFSLLCSMRSGFGLGSSIVCQASCRIGY